MQTLRELEPKHQFTSLSVLGCPAVLEATVQQLLGMSREDIPKQNRH